MPLLYLLISTTVFIWNIQDGDASSINNSPGTVSIQENYDETHNMWTITSTCYVQYTRAYTCYNRVLSSCGYWGFYCYRQNAYTCYAHAYTNVACNVCYINSDSSGHFQMSGQTVQKKACTSPLCGPSCTSSGCLNGDVSHAIGITCYRTGYNTNGAVSGSFTVSVYTANPPTFQYNGGASISVSHDTDGIGSVISTITPSVADNSNDKDYVRYRQHSGPGVSYIHQTADLFYLDTSNGQIKVKKDLTLEFSYTFSMNLCVYDRRTREVCHDLAITLHACFQTPNCTDQTQQYLHDTFGSYTGHDVGSNNVVFSQMFPQPDKHFTTFSTIWHDLTWTFVSNELPEAALNSDTGDIYITRNISIWPAWPTKTYNQEVRVSNSESCYTTTCTFIIIVHYTNWPIEILSLPDSKAKHEDDDNPDWLHDLVVYDYNYPYEDNITCYIDKIYPDETNMFILKHDGNHAYNSYSLFKLECLDPDCGYKHTDPQPYYCFINIGCMTHNQTQQYTITIKCDDAYNETDSNDFTFNVIKNAAPTYTHLPTQTVLNRKKVSANDKIFEIMYLDAENEDLLYEYSYKDFITEEATSYFLGTTWGNYYDNLGNITMTVHLWDKYANNTYIIQVCGHERRNEICEDLTVHVEEYCVDSPQCDSSRFETDTNLAIGAELFDLSTLVNGGSFDALTYSIKSQHGKYFSFDSTTGKVTLADTFPDIFDSATYSIIGYVYNAGSCSYGTCSLDVVVTAINEAVVITNLPDTVTMHEDTTTVENVFTVTASDNNVGDTYTCKIVNTASVEPFYLDRIPPESGSYVVKNRENSVLSSATTTYTLSIECTDSHDGSDTAVLTIDITLNEASVFTDFGSAITSITVDPTMYGKGATVYTIAATDTEGDELTFTCTNDNSAVPFECQTEQTFVYIKMSRDVNSVVENNVAYSVQVCVKDAKHSDTCGTLQVTFTDVHTRPEITNMNTNVFISEDVIVGSTIFQATISDPDAGETHTITMSVKPASSLSHFQLDTSLGTLTLATSLDYENVNLYIFLFNVIDSNGLSSLDEKYVILNVTNVNEANTIQASKTTLTFYENKTANTELTDPGLTCTDLDGDDTTVYAIDSGLHGNYFSIDSVSGILTLLMEWDLESSLPSSTSLVISCTDAGGLSSIVTITINIEDVNDNPPTITSSISPFTLIAIGPGTSLATVLAVVQASDTDMGDGGDFTFSILGSGVSFQYFLMQPVQSTRKRSTGTTQANLKLKKAIDFKNDKRFSITMKVSDGDATNPKYTGISVTIDFTSGEPEAKSKDATKCLTCTSNGKAIIAVLVIDGLLCISLGVHACCTMMCNKHKVLRLSDFDTSHNERFKLQPNLKHPSRTVATRASRKSTSSLGIPQSMSGKSVSSRQSPWSKADKSVSSRQSPWSKAGKSILTTAFIEMKKPAESSSDSSSSSSDDSDIDNIRMISKQVDVDHGTIRGALPSTLSASGSSSGLPAPMYSSGLNTPGSSRPVTSTGIVPGFIV